jgi:hypothetical protein
MMMMIETVLFRNWEVSIALQHDIESRPRAAFMLVLMLMLVYALLQMSVVQCRLALWDGLVDLTCTIPVISYSSTRKYGQAVLHVHHVNLPQYIPR